MLGEPRITLCIIYMHYINLMMDKCATILVRILIKLKHCKYVFIILIINISVLVEHIIIYFFNLYINILLYNIHIYLPKLINI